MTFYIRLSSPGGAPDTVPSAPAAPTITASSTQLVVTFTVPPSDGGSAITGYDTRHSVQGANSWTTVDLGISTPEPFTLLSLTNGTTYEVQVRAVNAVGDGAWSPSGTGTPVGNTFGYRAITNSSDPAGTAVGVPAGAQSLDTLIFIASRDFDIGGTVSAPSGATAAGTPTDQTGGYPSFLVWHILSWDGSTMSYDFGQASSWAGERSIIAMQGTASAVTAGTYTSGGGTAFTWTGMTMSSGDMAIAVGGLYDQADAPITSFDTSWTARKTQGTGEWAGLNVWTKQLSAGGTIAPSPAGTMTSANYASLLLRVQP